MSEACKNCRYARESAGHQCMVWHCRRRSPAGVPKPGWSESYQIGSWPEIAPSDWCGEWAKIGQQPAQPEPETSQERMWKWFWR